jgi:hypothetical protein
MNNVIEDIKKAMISTYGYQPAMSIIRLEFDPANKDNKIAWLDKFSLKTEYGYKTWYDVCLSLLGIGIVPDLGTLNGFNKLAMEFELHSDELIKAAKGEPIGR